MQCWENTVLLFLGGQRRGSTHGAENEGGQRGLLDAQGVAVTASPLRHSEQGMHEGALAAPLLVHWPAGRKARGEWREQPVHVVDWAPTFLKMAGVAWPKTGENEVAVPASDGGDLTPVLRENKSLPPRAFWWSQNGSRAFRLGDWKWVASKDRPVELYYLRADRSEFLDLAQANRERLLEMEVQWKRMEARFERDWKTSPPKSSSPLSVAP